MIDTVFGVILQVKSARVADSIATSGLNTISLLIPGN